MKFIYGLNGSANAVERTADGNFRIRVETLILKNGKVMINYTDKLNQYNRIYKIPGGSIEPELSLEESAAKECREEVRINIKNIRCCCKIKNKYKVMPEWHKRLLWPVGLKYVGSITYVFIADYESDYTGSIEEKDQDPEMINGSKFYDIPDIFDILCDEHKEILKNIKEN